MVAITFRAAALTLAVLVMIGLGCALIYPAIIRSTPSSFGREHALAIIGLQMARAHIGATLTPPRFGFIASTIHWGAIRSI